MCVICQIIPRTLVKSDMFPIYAAIDKRFEQIHQLFHKIMSINIILKSIKGHNSVDKFHKIMCISHNMDHIYQCINKILSKSIHYF